MAPRKKASSGGKKSSHLNKEPAQPSPPPKFGIQHFFERHSQTQKTLPQRSSKRTDDRPQNPISDSAGATNKNPHIASNPVINRKPVNDLDHAKVGDDNPVGMANLEKIESMGKYLMGENPINSAVSTTTTGLSDGCGNDLPVPSCVDVDYGNSRNGFDVGFSDSKRIKKEGSLLEVEESSPSVTPVDNLLPVVRDDERNQLEVSPEASKSISFKRFKFSPGMVIITAYKVG